LDPVKEATRCDMVEKYYLELQVPCMFCDPPMSLLPSQLRKFATKRIRELRDSEMDRLSGDRQNS
jgi:hypothetical protein